MGLGLLALGFLGAASVASARQPCHPDREWRQQGFFNYSGLLYLCGKAEACSSSGLCLSSCNSSVAPDACSGYPLVLCRADTCTHKDVFQGPKWQDILMGVISFMLSGLALSAGIGGGGFYVPLLQYLLGFSVDQSTALSQACLTGGSASVLLLNLSTRHPDGLKPLIDYRLMLVMCPFLLVGALFGQLLHVAAPSWLTLGLLTVILLYSFHTTAVKAFDTWRKEQAERAQEVRETPTSGPHASFEVVGSAAPPGEAQFPLGPLAVIASAWLFLGGSIFARGGPELRGLFGYCSPGYWVLVAATVAVLLALGIAGVMWASRSGAAASPRKARTLLEPPAEPSEEFLWTLAAAKRIAIWSLLAGSLASLCGIGGGLVMGPQLLKMGFKAQVQSATTATTLFIMSSTTALFYIAQGTAPADYVEYLLVCTACGSVLGKSVVNWLVKKYKRPSLVVFLLGALVGGSALVVVVDGLLKLIADAQTGKNMSFRNICDASRDAD